MSTVTPRADLVGSVAWIAFGAAIVAGTLQMDRLERFGATVYTAPGLVPGILGGLIAVLGIALLVRSLRRGAVATLGRPWLPSAEGRAMLARTGLAIALTLVYTLVLVGHGLPFWVVTIAFVFAFLLLFDLPERRAQGQTVRGLAVAALVAIVTSASVTLLFEQVFLVRMP
ncbi:MAG TPA: tripartite tricarboxylate transporter TctB family protein [Casimicrobiaceae bacterium]|nr:tripartite tricarboxylate transporter TctB family protein [Casimicrobiaceae bacterium]